MGFAIGIQYLTGYSVAATRPDGEPEWPPHPARVFMALAAAHFEAPGDDMASSPEVFEQSCQQERKALEWLESLDIQPAIYASDTDTRELVRFYVPINDASVGKKPAVVQSIPGWMRNKQQRTFPRVRLHNEGVFFIWKEELPEQYRVPLERLCAKVTRIGHSSSLVQMWLADPAEVPEPNWVPDEERSMRRLRAISAGFLGQLERLYGENDRQRHHFLRQEIKRLQSEKRSLKGQGATQRKAQLQAQIDELTGELEALGEPPVVIRPTVSLWQGYARPAGKVNGQLPGTVWDSELLVLRIEPIQSPFRRLDLTSTLQVTGRFREALLQQAHQLLCGCSRWEEGAPTLEDARTCWQKLPEWLTGHKSDGARSESPHIAYLPLAFVGGKYGDGHLMGLALGIPTILNRSDRRRIWQIVQALCNQPLKLGRLGLWQLSIEDRESPRHTLRPDTWTAHEQGARCWGSITPVAFDKHPNAKDPQTHDRLLVQMVQDGCRRIGLPEPSKVMFMPVSVHIGAPTSREFPALLRKDGSARRHLHATIIFPNPVRGPIAICAGRYRGYGFFRSIPKSEESLWA